MCAGSLEEAAGRLSARLSLYVRDRRPHGPEAPGHWVNGLSEHSRRGPTCQVQLNSPTIPPRPKCGAPPGPPAHVAPERRGAKPPCDFGLEQRRPPRVRTAQQSGSDAREPAHLRPTVVHVFVHLDAQVMQPARGLIGTLVIAVVRRDAEGLLR